MIDRICLKCREVIHLILHIGIYRKANIILRGVPQILYGNNIKFGNSVRINDKVFLHAANGIIIGNNTTLSYGACLISESYDLSSKENYLNRKHAGDRITIGENVWICAKVVVLPGVSIADNIVVGAGSVVTSDLQEENSLYAGNPARFIKKLEM